MDDESVSRRKMIALGAVGGAALLNVAGASPASAAPESTRPQGTVPASLSTDVRIGSDAISGYSYLHRSWHDFYSFDLGSRTWSPEGVYAAGPDQWLTSTVDLQAGAVLRDVEWYVTSPDMVSAYIQLWNSGSAFIETLDGATFPAGDTTARALRQVLPTPNGVPIALGSKLVLNLPTGPRTRLIGARIGFTT